MAKKGKKNPSPNDNRSNVKNRNNPANKASLNNHSRLAEKIILAQF